MSAIIVYFIVAILLLFICSVSTYSLYISKLTNTYWVSAVYQVLQVYQDRKKFKK